MLDLARARVGDNRVKLVPMQTLEEGRIFDCIVSLSWSLNYCQDQEELRAVLSRCRRALRPGGGLIVQVAHSQNAGYEVPSFLVDKEPGPGGPNDIILHYRFWAGGPQKMFAEYQFECVSTRERFEEIHQLGVADVRLIAECLEELKFENIEIFDSCNGESFTGSISPIVFAR